MLSVFPDLFTYELLGVFLIRITLGLIFIYFAYCKIWKQKDEKVALFATIGFRPPLIFFWLITIIEFVGGVLLLIGLFVQPTAAILSILMLGTLIIKLVSPNLFLNGAEFYLLLFISLVSLLFLAPGFLAIDIPL